MNYLLPYDITHMVFYFMTNIASHFNRQFILFSLSIIALLQTSMAFSFAPIDNIALSTLGGFDAKFSTIEKVNSIEGQQAIGEVNIKSGENYSINLPFNVQRIHYHVKNGSLIKKGATVASVEGYEVAHFFEEYTLAKKLLAVSENNFQANKKYAENNIIKNAEWVAITKTYFEAKLNFEHLHHQMTFLHQDENGQVTLISPKAGIVKTSMYSSNRHLGMPAFDLIDPSAIQVKISLPTLNISSLSHLQVSANCQLTINSVEDIVSKYHQTLWASPSKGSECKLTLGEIITVTPIQKFNGYSVNKSAIFEFENNNYLAIKSDKDLAIINVNLLGEKYDHYYFTSTHPLKDKSLEGEKALTSSVSILQGHLLNLGAE